MALTLQGERRRRGRGRRGGGERERGEREGEEKKREEWEKVKESGQGKEVCVTRHTVYRIPSSCRLLSLPEEMRGGGMESWRE